MPLFPIQIDKSFPDRAGDVTRAASEATARAGDALLQEARGALDEAGLAQSALKARLKVERESATGDTVVVAEAPEAVFVEFGTRRMPARPFLGASLERLRRPLTTTTVTKILAALRKPGAGA